MHFVNFGGFRAPENKKIGSCPSFLYSDYAFLIITGRNFAARYSFIALAGYFAEWLHSQKARFIRSSRHFRNVFKDTPTTRTTSDGDNISSVPIIIICFGVVDVAGLILNFAIIGPFGYEKRAVQKHDPWLIEKISYLKFE